MSWHSKVAWSEGLFLRQHHLQQLDRYFEKTLQLRTRYASPHPWGFSHIEIDHDLSEQNRFGLRRAAGIFQDGTPFDLPNTGPLPTPIEVPEGAERQLVWLTLPTQIANTFDVDMPDSDTGSRYFKDLETVIDSASRMQVVEQIEVAHPRVALDIRSTPKEGHECLKIARIQEIRDKTITFDERFAPPVISLHAHPVSQGWLDRVIGWIETKLETLSRYAADPSARGGFQTLDYFMLQVLNREINVLRQMRYSKYTHPAHLHEELLRLSGELWTFSSKSRRAPEYDPYDQDDLETIMEPLLDDIQRLLSLNINRPIHIDLVERAPNAYTAAVTDRSLFQNATFIIEVAANQSQKQIQDNFPALCKVGPNTKMNEIVRTHLPGIELIHMPTPPRQIRTISDHVYFRLDKNSPLWPEFSAASGIGLHFSGVWPELQLDLWAIVEDG